MSIHRVAPLYAPTDLALLFTVVGRGTKWLSHRRQGDVIDILGPLGNSFQVHSHKLLLVAGGMGIAALGFLAEKATADGHHVTLLSGAKTRDKVYPLDRFMPGISAVEIVTEDGSLGKQGLATDILADFDHIAGLTAVDSGDLTGPDQIFACGPVSMYETMARLDWLKGKSVQVSMEARMGCGFGGCYGCAIETKRGLKLVCRDGPVFELRDVIR